MGKETQGTNTVQDATDQNQLQIRYNADGRIDILQDISGLSPGVYSIAPVHKNGRSSSSVMRADGFQNNLLVYPNPESVLYSTPPPKYEEIADDGFIEDRYI